jgi:hypothetical protein
MKKLLIIFALSILSCFLQVFPTASAQDNKVVVIQSPKDAWELRHAETTKILRTINDPKSTKDQLDKAIRELDARLTEAEQGRLTPIETMELLGVFYVPKELQNKEPNYALLFRLIATQATLGWYDALRYTDESGRAEIVNNVSFFRLAFGSNAQKLTQYMKDHPEQIASAVKTGIQDAHNAINAKRINYDTQWPGAYGMTRMMCAMSNAKVCDHPPPRPTSEWPALLDQADKRVSASYIQ